MRAPAATRHRCRNPPPGRPIRTRPSTQGSRPRSRLPVSTARPTRSVSAGDFRPRLPSRAHMRAQGGPLVSVRRDRPWRISGHGARGTFIVDLPAVGENAKRIGDAAGAGVHHGAQRTAHRAQPVADCGAVQPARSLSRMCQGDHGVIGLLDVGEHRQRAVLGDIGRPSHATDAALSGADAGPVPYMLPRRALLR